MKRSLIGSMLFFGAVATACGGAATSGADAESVPQAPPEPEALVEAAALEAEPVEETPAEVAPAEPVDKLTFQMALQAALEDYELIDAMKLDKPGRTPLKIAGKGLPEGLSVIVKQHNVQVVPMPDDPAKAGVLVFTRIEVSAERGKFKYRFPAESIGGISRVGPGDGKWLLLSSQITEF